MNPGPRRSEVVRSGRRRPVVVTGLTLALLVAMLPVSVTLAAPASAQRTTSATCPGATSAPYLLPAWSDASGWTHPDQFRTIMSGDLDGDGVGELIGRNASNLEIFTWADPSGAPGKAYDPGLGQWTQILPVAEPPSFATADGWWDPSTSSTFQLADLDGKGGDELLVRTVDGVVIYAYDGAATVRTFVEKNRTGLLTDVGGWGQSHPEYWSTITTGNVDGHPGDEILARGTNGLEAYSLDGNVTNGLRRVDGGDGILSDAAYWNRPEHYSTIRVADFDNDGVDEVAGRGVYGVELYDLTGGVWVQAAGDLVSWSDADDWTVESYYRTISAADLDGDGQVDLLARSAAGLDAWTRDGAGWRQLAPSATFSDEGGYLPSQYGLTVQPADILPAPGSEVIGRGGGGLVTVALEDGAWVEKPGVISQFSDANGWGAHTGTPPVTFDPSAIPEDYRYSTIQPVTVRHGAPQMIIGRDATGVRTVQADGSSPTAGFAAYTDMRVSLAPDAPIISFEPGTDLDPLGDDQLKRAYWYLNSYAVSNGWWSDGKTILDEFGDTTSQDKIAELNSKLSGDGLLPGEQQAVNVPRGQFEAVSTDVRDWTNAVQKVYGHIYGPTGVKQLITDTFVASQGEVDAIKVNFEEDAALVALLGDLLWGFIGALGALAAAIPGLDVAAAALFSAIGGLVGSGVAAGAGFGNPNYATDTQAAQLNQTMVDTFLCASEFAGTSFDQAVANYGLLMSSFRLLEQQSLSGGEYATMVNTMFDAKKLWIWQQFGNRDFGENFWLGVCDFGRGYDCEWSQGDPYTWSPPEDPNISYRLIGKLDGSQNGYCDYVILRDGNDDLRALYEGTGTSGVPAFAGLDVISPRITDGTLPGLPAYNSGVGTGGAGRTGILGWNLPRWQCDDGDYLP